jgi:cell division transport system ATP-binding protein
LVELENVTKIYPGAKKPALDNVSLKIEEGEFVFLVGPSGSGKTTLIKLMLREILPTSGIVRVAGIDVTRLRSWRFPT